MGAINYGVVQCVSYSLIDVQLLEIHRTICVGFPRENLLTASCANFELIRHFLNSLVSHIFRRSTANTSK
jgi:hypothetical protein